MLETHARQMCGEDYEVWKAINTENWKWDGPEVTRIYPFDAEIKRIEPDSRGFRLVKYKVRLTFRDPQGRIAKVENFTAQEIEPAGGVRPVPAPRKTPPKQ